MLTYIAIDNYKTFDRFEWSPGPVALVMGGNGVGKSGLFEVLDRLREMVCGDGNLATCFPYTSRTRWLKARYQTFTVRMDMGLEQLTYVLRIVHTPNGESVAIEKETLSVGDLTLFQAENGYLVLYDDNGKQISQFQGVSNKSGLSMVVPNGTTRRLYVFKRWLAGALLLRPNPWMMDSRAPTEAEHLHMHMDNFASWYRHAVQTDTRAVVNAADSFREIVPGFESMSMRVDEQRTGWLRANFMSFEGGAYTLRFEELSEGQRILFALYAVLHAQQATVLTLDEPDNFVALDEIQPFLHDVLDRALTSEGPQVFIVSHHPEYLDQLAPEYGWVVRRDLMGATRITRFHADVAMPPSELMARGELTGRAHGSEP